MTKYLGVIEGFYGNPYTWEQRADLIRWCGQQQLTHFVLSPKDEPLLRASWRDSLPTDEISTLVKIGLEAGVTVAVVISPGLDWRGEEDHAPLVAKARLLQAAGVTSIGIAWDDVPRGGADLGASHAAGVAAVAAALPGVEFSTCPTDYAASTPTSYLAAFSAGLPEGMPMMWTGTGIVSDTLSAEEVRTLSTALGRRLVFADNVPVNDGPMSGVLHLGPYPERDPGIIGETDGLLLNLIPGMPLASRITAGAAIRWWRNPDRDREECWRESFVPGIEPLARACRSWLTSPGPDEELLRWVREDHASLAAWLALGCREGLAPEWAAELAEWLDAWDLEALLMTFVIDAVKTMDAVEAAFATAEGWRRVRALPQQLFGIRRALYPVTEQVGDTFRASSRGLVEGLALSDILCTEMLKELLV